MRDVDLFQSCFGLGIAVYIGSSFVEIRSRISSGEINSVAFVKEILMSFVLGLGLRGLLRSERLRKRCS